MFDNATKDNIMVSLMVFMYLCMILSAMIVFAVGITTIVKVIL